MKRIKLTVAYDGTNYCGWQIQDNGITIEEVLNRELSKLLQEDIKIIGASRTDSGVHALGNVAVFDTETRIPPEKISFALNQRLPDDIRIQESCQVADDFHPRFCDTIKTYEYRIWNDKFPNPLVRLYSKFCYFHVDVAKMEQAAAYLIGEHDFKSFCTPRTQVESTVRTVTEISFRTEGKMIIMTIMVGRIKLSAPKSRRQINPHPSPINTLGRFFDSIHCSTMITTNNAVIAKSIPVVSIGRTEPSSAPIADPMIQ